MALLVLQFFTNAKKLDSILFKPVRVMLPFKSMDHYQAD